MPTAAINTPHCRVTLVSERLEVALPAEENGGRPSVRNLPLRDLDRLLLLESAQISTPALAELLRRDIPVALLDRHGRYLGAFQPAARQHGLARIRQYQCAQDPSFALGMAGRIVTAKLYNQRRVLQRLNASRGEPGGKEEDAGRHAEVTKALRWLEAFFASIRIAGGIEELRGYEGASSARYFGCWAKFLPAEFPFERRSRRPPLNPVNACISFGATLLYNEAVSFLHAHGLDPALGLLHTTENGRWSLALDLMEPFRPVLIEALTLDLFVRGMVKNEHFRVHNGGIYLNDVGRHKFILQYERRMERQFMSESVGHRTTLRQQLEQQAVRFKGSLENASRFEPFLMN
jgi:CRISPR-associated protein Cas1